VFTSPSSSFDFPDHVFIVYPPRYRRYPEVFTGVSMGGSVANVAAIIAAAETKPRGGGVVGASPRVTISISPHLKPQL
jgi:hypothetical protein